MTLDLKRVTKELDTSKYATSTTTTVTPNATNSTANATQVDAGMNALNGYQSVYRDNGCVDVVVKAGSYYSPFLKQQADIGTANVDTLVNNAQSAGYKVEAFDGYAKKAISLYMVITNTLLSLMVLAVVLVTVVAKDTLSFILMLITHGTQTKHHLK